MCADEVADSRSVRVFDEERDLVIWSKRLVRTAMLFNQKTKGKFFMLRSKFDRLEQNKEANRGKYVNS